MKWQDSCEKGRKKQISYNLYTVDIYHKLGTKIRHRMFISHVPRCCKSYVHAISVL